MSQQNLTPLEKQLEQATRWEGAAPELWAKALESERSQSTGRGRMSGVLAVLRRPSSILAACLAVALCGVMIMALNAPVAGRARGGAAAPSVASGPEFRSSLSDGGSRSKVLEPPPPPMAYEVTSQPDAKDLVNRVVIRKATIELETTDVRAAFAKAAMLVSEAGGEFVQESSLAGGASPREEGKHDPLYGTITLRVGVKRLSEVLNRLRELGVVTAETAGGEDVTDQAVDLDARLRNEQRIETELLELLSSRKDAPLKEILEVREQISNARERIERLTAQRDRLSQLASLATVLVIIREPNVGDPAAVQGRAIGGYFADRMAAAWRNGLTTLSNSIGWIVSVIVGGAPWWIVIAVMAAVLVRLLRHPPAPPAPPAPKT